VRLITRLHAEIVSLQVLADEALTSSGLQPDSGLTAPASTPE
jgi:hypothetical protein